MSAYTCTNDIGGQINNTVLDFHRTSLEKHRRNSWFSFYHASHKPITSLANNRISLHICISVVSFPCLSPEASTSPAPPLADNHDRDRGDVLMLS